ncbi:FAD-binding oxidoreductase [Chloroflexi bacterium TSY]|nr:FAD-binding oxidoreductase [Chloroflexi bacterium TSY]
MNRNSNNQLHIVVVGAGILGASIAFHLTLRGAQVTIVDALSQARERPESPLPGSMRLAKTPFTIMT